MKHRILLLVSLLACAAALGAQAPTTTRDCRTHPEQLARLSLLTVGTGRLAPGEAACLAVELQAGDFVRISVDADAGYLRARLFAPRRDTPLQTTLIWSFFPSLPLAVEATESGWHVLELSVPAQVPFEEVPTFRAQVLERTSAEAEAARLRDLRGDPRVAWLREHAIRVRSIDPEDTDFSDLQFLRDALRGSRVVLLGEGDHGGGSDVLAKTRLTKFLHREMGFDVVAFEAGLHSSAVAWRALQTDVEPRDAVLKGLFGILGRAAQAGPLIRYLWESARSERPLEVAGVDSQFTGTAAGSLLPELQQFLRGRAIVTPLAEEDALPARVLAGVLDGRFARDRKLLPQPAEQAEAVEALRATAAEVERRGADRESAFWAQVLRSTAVQVGLLLGNLRGASDTEYGAGRDRQMSENLLWLANAYYRGRRIVVWAHTSHTMRSPQATSHGR